MDYVTELKHGDSERVYLAGQSMGGNGAWQYLAMQPQMFAGALVICGYAQGAHGLSATNGS